LNERAFFSCLFANFGSGLVPLAHRIQQLQNINLEKDGYLLMTL